MLRITKISFPGLGIGEFDVNSVAFSPFGVDIAWYALIITFGMVVCVAFACYMAKKVGIDYDHILDMAIFTITSGIIGARLYYVIIEHDRFSSFAEIIDIRGGGMAIYGGIIGGAVAVFLVCKFKKLRFKVVADFVYPGVMLAQAIGRWGNFMNGEAYGCATSLPWRMHMNSLQYADAFLERMLEQGYTKEMLLAGEIGAHPTFLYESLWNIIGFCILVFVLYKRKQYDGQIYYLGAAYYGLGRFMIESLRTDSMFVGEIRTNQIIAITAFIVYTALLIYNAIKKTSKHEPAWIVEPKKKQKKIKTKTES